MFFMLSVGKQSKLNKPLLSESRGCLAGSDGFSCVKYTYVKLLCESKREKERELCGQVE